MKDLEWLKEEVRNCEYITEHDIRRLSDLIDEVEQQELPEIPDYVAEYIKNRRESSYPLYQAIRIVGESSRFKGTELSLWLSSNENQETFAKAWVNGYTVEEKKYRIHFGNHKYAQRFNEKWLSSQITDKEFASTFTKEEIINLDNSDLYWNNFAEEVTE